MLQINAWTVFLAAFLTALATGLGAIPFFFVAGLARRWLGASNAAAAGLMVAASHSLINEGMPLSTMRVFVGVLAGLVFMAASRRLLSGGGRDLQIGQLRGADATKALIVVGAMTLHSVAEGVSVGVAYGGSDALGVFISAAIAVHNIPEGLAISLVLVPRGVKPWSAAGWSVFSSLPQPLMAVPAFLFVLTFRPFLPVGLGFAAGAMLWLVFTELVPDTLEQASARVVAVSLTLSLMAMLAFQQLLRSWSY